jgi:hypothetical protein
MSTMLITGCTYKAILNDEQAPDLTASTWNYTDSDGDEYTITFLEGGKIKSTHPNDTTPDNDFWKQEGTVVKFSFNDAYSEYHGAFKNKNRITGTASNTKGKKWTWQLKH